MFNDAVKENQSIAPLHVLLQYSNRDVLESFCSSFSVNEEEAKEIFQEMLKFLWLSNTSDERILKVIDQPIAIIDEMWHVFILFTQEYAEFCHSHFGRFIHHAPTVTAEKVAISEELRNRGNARLLREKRRRYELIYERLGRETFVKWFHQFPDRYSRERIREIRRK